jgi:hypothetical protein
MKKLTRAVVVNPSLLVALPSKNQPAKPTGITPTQSLDMVPLHQSGSALS